MDQLLIEQLRRQWCNMKKPKAPVKPQKPDEPKKYLELQERSCSIYTGQSLADILKQIEGHRHTPFDSCIDLKIDLENIYFDATRGYYDDYDYQFTWQDSAKLNPTYEKELAKYETEMVEYQEKMKIYENEVVDYKVREKQYLKWFHASELKKLG